MKWSDQSSSKTPLRPEPEVVHICIIDADPIFSRQLGERLAGELPKMVNIVGMYDGIPDVLEVPYEVSLVIFDPELDDFRRLSEAISRMRESFGQEVHLAVHGDFWTEKDNQLKRDLQNLDIWYGFRRYDFRRCIKLVTKIAMGEPVQLWHLEFIS
ncbi:MAG: hypothetical protein AAB668_04450 [Patescibacteria group bacterium]